MSYYSIEDYWQEENEYLDSLPPHYTLVYKGYLFEGDSDEGYNRFSTDSWDNVISIFNAYSAEQRNEMDMSIDDNIYGVSLDADGAWW